MAKILIISALFPPEPVVSANLSKDIALKLSEDDEVVVVCPKPTRPLGYNFSIKEEEQTNLNYKKKYLNSFVCPESKLFGRIKESYSFGNECVKYIKQNKSQIDKIYINSWPFISQYLIVRIAKSYNIKTVLHIQDIYPESFLERLPKRFSQLVNKFLLPFDVFTLNNADKIIGISNRMINYLSTSRGVDINKFEMVRNWQDDDLFSKSITNEKLTSHTFTFMYVGNIGVSAGVDVLIKSFNEAKLENSQLIIAGDGSEKENCIKLAEDLNCKNIEFLDVTPKLTPNVQAKATVLLLPLRKGVSLTATPSKLTAYLLSGKPVLACVESNSDVSNILSKGNCGAVREPENIKSIINGMQEMYSKPKKELDEMGKNGRIFAKNNLSKEVNLMKCISIIKKL